MSEPFSKRHGFRQPLEADISVRHDAPFELRGIVVQVAYECGFSPSKLRALVCRVLRRRPDPTNWSEYPNIDNEVHELLDECPWYRVYDVVEAVIAEAGDAPYSYDAEKFQSELNEYFFENGIGWKLSGGYLEVRGGESFEQLVQSANTTLVEAGFATARKELHEAIRDLSRRPEPDVTGAIQHAMAAL